MTAPSQGLLRCNIHHQVSATLAEAVPIYGSTDKAVAIWSKFPHLAFLVDASKGGVVIQIRLLLL